MRAGKWSMRQQTDKRNLELEKRRRRRFAMAVLGGDRQFGASDRPFVISWWSAMLWSSARALLSSVLLGRCFLCSARHANIYYRTLHDTPVTGDHSVTVRKNHGDATAVIGRS